MKKLYLVALILFSYLKGYGQDDLCITSLYPSIENGNVFLTIHNGIKKDENERLQAFYGFNPQVMVSEFVGLNYNFNFGKGYGRLPFFASNFWSEMILTTDDDGILCALFVLALIPEGVTFHIPITSNLKIAPYINFMGSELHKGAYEGNTKSFRGSYNIGSSFLYNFNNTIIAPFVEFGGLYNYSVNGIRTGLALGWVL